MKYVLFILAVFSLALSPAMAAEPCMDDMSAQTADAVSMTTALDPALADADCCDISERDKAPMPDDCALTCALGCAGYIPGFAAPSGKDGHLIIAMTHFPPDNGALLAMAIAFEPPPPRI